jgi:uncharacterized delta-60 repeat protein
MRSSRRPNHRSSENSRESDRTQPEVILQPRKMSIAAASLLAALGLCLSVLAGPAWAGAGGLDPSFGVGGIATTPLETAPRTAVELGVGPDGSAVVGEPSSYLVRFGPEGATDPVFGAGGKLSLTPDPIAEGVAGRSLSPSNFVVDGAGRLLVFGDQSDAAHTYPIPRTTENQTATESEAVVMRFDQQGKLDASFGTGGFVRSSFGLRSRLHTKMPLTAATVGGVDSKNRPVLVVGGAAVQLGCHAGAVTYYPLGVVRLTNAGAKDRSFAGDGVAPISGSTGSPRLDIDAAGRPAIGLGRYLRPTVACHAGTALARLGADGAPLGRFGSHGSTTLRQNLDLDFVTPSGAMILSHLSGRTLKVVRIGLSGRPDGSFGDHGTAKVRLPVAAGAHVRPVGVDAKGRIVLAGLVGANGAYPVLSSNISRPPTLTVGRLLPDGRPDRSLGDGGWILDRVPGTDEVGVSTAALDRQGRLLLAATITAPGQGEGGYLLARFLLGS